MSQDLNNSKYMSVDRENRGPAPVKHQRNIVSILAKAPEATRRAINTTYEGIVPDMHGRNPRVVSKIQHGLLRLLEAALNDAGPATLTTPQAFGEVLLRTIEDPRALIKGSDEMLREIQTEAHTLASIIMAIPATSKNSEDVPPPQEDTST